MSTKSGASSWTCQRSRRTKRLTVAKFSCEASAEHRRVCAAAGVRQYPTITYYAHDKLRFGPLFGARRSAPPLRSVNYRGIALYEALRDWTVALHGISEAQRLGDWVKQLLGWQRSPRDLEAAAPEHVRALQPAWKRLENLPSSRIC